MNIDESTVLKTSQLALTRNLTLRYFHRTQGRIVCEHYKTVDIVTKDAATHIANALKYGLLAFDKSMKTIFVDVYEDLEKYPSHQLRYTDACKVVGIVAKPIMRMVDTRWTVIGSCAARLFAQFAVLEHMYGKLSLTKKDTEARDESRLYRLMKQKQKMGQWRCCWMYRPTGHVSAN